MSNETTLRPIGEGVIKTGARPIQVHVGNDGEYWLCDAHTDAGEGTYESRGCIRHSDTHMAEGG